jgi:hypothetical protein
MIVRSFFRTKPKHELADALFGVKDTPKVYPSHSSSAKIRWENDFNMIVFHLKFLNIVPIQESIIRVNFDRRDIFIQILTVVTAILWKQLAFNLQPIKSTIPPPIANDSISPRPTLSQINFPDSTLFQNLHDPFFRKGGYLRYDLKDTINFDDKTHGFVRFQGHESNDLRWFLPFQMVHPKHQGTFYSDSFQHVLCF